MEKKPVILVEMLGTVEESTTDLHNTIDKLINRLRKPEEPCKVDEPYTKQEEPQLLSSRITAILTNITNAKSRLERLMRQLEIEEVSSVEA